MFKFFNVKMNKSKVHFSQSYVINVILKGSEIKK
jgi:hypothetical protein